jgi:hypothetical protein
MADAFLALQKMFDTFSGYSARDIEEMPMGEYVRLREQAGLAPIAQPARDMPPPAPVPPVAAPEAPPESAGPRAVDVSQLSMDEYAQFRDQIGIGQGRQEGRGALDGATYQQQVDGARAQYGRTALSNGNVTPARAVPRVYLDQDDHRDPRSARDRFSNGANVWHP